MKEQKKRFSIICVYFIRDSDKFAKVNVYELFESFIEITSDEKLILLNYISYVNICLIVFDIFPFCPIIEMSFCVPLNIGLHTHNTYSIQICMSKKSTQNKKGKKSVNQAAHAVQYSELRGGHF